MLYIPTEQERINIYEKITSLSPMKENNHHNNNPQQQEQHTSREKKTLTKKQTSKLVERLCKETKRQNEIYKQIKTIKQINLVTNSSIQHKKKRQEEENKVQQRLIKQGLKMKEKKQILKAKVQEEQGKLLQEKPSISQYARQKSMKNPKSFLQRVDDINSEKQLLMKVLTKKLQPSFQPSINLHSKFIAEISNDQNLNFLNRVDAYERTKQRKNQQKKQQILQVQKQSHAFKPEINPLSRIIASNVNSREKIKKKNIPNNDLTFQPKVNPRSKQLASKNKSTMCHERLYDDMKRISNKKNSIKQERDSMLDFKPKINSKSIKMVQERERRKEEEQQESQVFEEVYAEDHNQFLFQESRSIFESSREFSRKKGRKSSKLTSIQ